MIGIDTIVYVTPALQPAGAMNPEVAMGAIRSRVAAQGQDMVRQQSGRTLRRLFGPTSLSSGLSYMLLVGRILIGGWCAREGVSTMVTDGFGIFPVLFIVASLLIGIGLFTRLTASAAALVSVYALCHLLSEGMPALNAGMLAAMFAVAALVGPGRYSIDARLRRKIFRWLSRREMDRLLNNRFSYRAYEFAHYN